MPPRAAGVAASPTTRVGRTVKEGGSRGGREQDRLLLLQRYQLEPRPIGRGAYGTVYLADDVLSEDSSARVAVKSLSKEETPENSCSEEEQREKVQQEVRIQRALRHCPFACQVLGVDEDDESLYIIMEHVNGPSLQTVLDMRGKLTEREAALAIHDILQVSPTPVCSACVPRWTGLPLLCSSDLPSARHAQVVTSCHGQGICHSDVKPANFLYHYLSPIQEDEQQEEASWIDGPRSLPLGTRVLKGIDFGCSQTVSAASPTLTVPKGTPCYSAPEVIQQRYGCEADMWSCGVVLYQLLTGRLPLWTDTSSLSKQQVLEAVLRGKVRFDGPEWRRISPDARDLCERMLKRDPHKRIAANEAIMHSWVQHNVGHRRGSAFASKTVPHWKDT